MMLSACFQSGRSIPLNAIMTGTLLVGLLQSIQASPASGQLVSGQVTDAATERPVPSAKVVVRDAAGSLLQEVVTQATGHFALLDIPEGDLLLEVSAFGYTASAKRKIRYDGNPVFLAIELSPAPLQMEGITVTVEAQDPFLKQSGYYHRIRVGHGYFFTPEQLNLMSLSRPSDMLRRIAAVKVTGNGEPFMARGTMSFGNCRPAVYQDGLLVRGSRSSAPFNDVVVPATQIMAVEVYPGPASTPAQWQGSSACGVIVIWTRH